MTLCNLHCTDIFFYGVGDARGLVFVSFRYFHFTILSGLTVASLRTKSIVIVIVNAWEVLTASNSAKQWWVRTTKFRLKG